MFKLAAPRLLVTSFLLCNLFVFSSDGLRCARLKQLGLINGMWGETDDQTKWKQTLPYLTIQPARIAILKEAKRAFC